MRRTQEEFGAFDRPSRRARTAVAAFAETGRSGGKIHRIQEEERLLKAQLQVLQWKALDDKAGLKEKEINALELEREAIVTEQVGLNTGIEQARDQHSQLNDAFNEVQGRFYSIGAEIARAEQGIQHQQQRRQQLDADLQQLSVNMLETTRHLESDREKIALWEEEITEIEPELEITDAAEEKCRRRIG